MKIKVNNKVIATNSQSLFALKSELFGSSQSIIAIADGFQTSDDLPLDTINSVIFIDKSKLPGKKELEYMMTARNTPQVQGALKAARVAVAGLGGLGSNIATALARTGVGTLHLVDFDTVEPSNLNRQQYFVSHLGLAKTEAMVQLISQINPYIHIITDCVRVTPQNVHDIFKEDKIICEAFDNPQAKAMLINSLLEANTNKKIIAASGMAGYESCNTVITRKINDSFYLCGDSQTGAKQGRGLMAPRVQVCAGHQANMALRLILNKQDV